MEKKFVNPFVEQRRETFARIREMIERLSKASGEPITYTQLNAFIQVQFGLSDKTARIYLKKLKEAGFILVEKGMVTNNANPFKSNPFK